MYFSDPTFSAQPGFLSLQDAARWASVSKKTVERWIKMGLPVYQSRPRMIRLVRPKDIEQFLKTPPPSEIGHLTQLVAPPLTGAFSSKDASGSERASH